MKAATCGSDLWPLAPPSLTHQGIGLGGKEPHLNKGLSLQQAQSQATPEQQGRDRHNAWGQTAPAAPRERPAAACSWELPGQEARVGQGGKSASGKTFSLARG